MKCFGRKIQCANQILTQTRACGHGSQDEQLFQYGNKWMMMDAILKDFNQSNGGNYNT